MHPTTTIIIDTENTIFQKGNPFSRRNKCCAFAYLSPPGESRCIKVEYDSPVDSGTLRLIQDLIDQCGTIIAFNAKYDLHWLRRYGILLDRQRVWCTQTAQFVIQNQQVAYPSLEGCCEYWGLGSKIDTVKKEYWDRGIDTPEVPWEILSEYASKDVDLTYSLYLKQKEYLRDKPKLERLISLLNQDLVVLAEMEWNGLRYNVDESLQRAERCNVEIVEIDNNLKTIMGEYPWNFNSPDHVSAILYGGVAKFKIRLPYEHIYKTGPKAGTTAHRFKHFVEIEKFSRLVNPLPKSELKKPGLFSTDAKTLVQLRPKGKAKKLIQLLQRRSEIEQLSSTYYNGWPKRIAEMDWEPGHVHSNLNQNVVITGRLSSSKPNQQNIPPEVYELIETRFH